MTGSQLEYGSHIDDGDLIRLIDNECSQAERIRISDHIDGCSECRDNLEALKTASGLFSEAAAELDLEAGPMASREEGERSEWREKWEGAGSQPHWRFSSARVWRIAAVLAVTVLVFTATPARAWLADGWAAFRSLVADTPRESPVEPVPVVDEAAQPTMSSVLRFSTSGDEFRLEFVVRPAGGSLVIVIDTITSASAAVFGESNSDEMILLPAGLRIRNSSTSNSSYEVRLPNTLDAVEVVVGGSTEVKIDVGSVAVPFRRELNLAGQTND